MYVYIYIYICIQKLKETEFLEYTISKIYTSLSTVLEQLLKVI